ncbi:MAG: hypothetical protein H0V83_13695 [Rubrobacter sp.]|nr:hypothetical protein [Rubrobacter sp.]
MGDYEIWRQHREEISRQVRQARAGRRSRDKSSLMGDLRWELARYRELLSKHLNIK